MKRWPITAFYDFLRNFINQGVTNHSKINTLRYFKCRSSALANKAKATTGKRFKIISEVLEDVKNRFPETDFIEEHIQEECSKENMSKEEVNFFLHITKQRVSTEKNISYLVVLSFKAEMFLL